MNSKWIKAIAAKAIADNELKCLRQPGLNSNLMETSTLETRQTLEDTYSL